MHVVVVLVVYKTVDLDCRLIVVTEGPVFTTVGATLRSLSSIGFHYYFRANGFRYGHCLCDIIFRLSTVTVKHVVESKCNMLHCLLYRNTQNGIICIFSWTDDDGSR